MNNIIAKLRASSLHAVFSIHAVLMLAATSAFAADVQVTGYGDNPDPVPATQTVTYTMTVENSAADTANDVNVTASVPAGMSFISATPSTGTCTFIAPNVQCTLGSLLGTGSGGSPVTISIIMRAMAGGGSSPTTVATATTSSADTNPANNSLSQQTTITSGADLALTVTDSPDPVNGSGVITYTLSPQNLGPDGVVNARIVNTLPPGVNFISAAGSGWSCSQSGQVVTCNRADTQAPGALPQLVIQGRVNIGSGNITNSATISSPVTPDGIPANDTALTTTAVNPGTDLGISKGVSPTPVIAGQAATFTLNTVNNGPSAASTVIMSDTLPAGFTGIAASGPGWTCGVSGQTVSCTLASYAAGTSSAITITATAPASVPPAGLASSNTATIASATFDGVSSNDSSTVNFNINPLQADLSLTKSKTPNPVAQGSNMTSTIVIRNNGPLAATSPINMTDSLAPGESFVSASGTNWSCAHSGPTPGGVVTCSYVNIPAGVNSNPLTIITTATNTGSLGNTACTGGSAIGGNTHPEGDVNTANDCASATSNSTGQIADLAIAKSIPNAADNPLVPTDNGLTYRLTISNSGPNTSTNVIVTDTIPMYTSMAGGTGLSFSPGAGSLGSPAGTCSNSGATVTCNYAQLQNGETATIDITVTRPMLDGAFTNTANITSTSIGDPNPGNNSSSIGNTVQAVADVEMTGKSVTPSIVRAGVEASYVLTFRNNGPSTAQNVIVTDTFNPAPGDTGFTVISFTPSKGSCAGLTPGTSYTGTQTLTCNIGSMIANEGQTVTIIIRPNHMASPPASRTIPNTASITTTTQESDGPPSTVNTNNSKNGLLTIDPALLDVLINKTDAAPYGPDPVGYDPVTPANNVFAYRIRVTNNGPSFATGVVFTDTITTPAGKNLSFLGDTATLGAPAAGICSGTASPFTGSGIFTCTVPTGIATGASYERVLYFRAESSPAGGGDTFSDSASVTTNEADSNPGNNTAVESTTVRVRTDLAVTSKTAAPNPVNLREPFNWTIVVTNNGPGDASNPRLSDTLPANMELTGTPNFTKTAPAGSGSCTGSAGATSFTCDFGALNNAASATITVPVRITSFAASYTNSASISTQGNEVDPVAGNNTNSGTVNMVKSSIAGVVYRDQNDDGAQSGATETGIAGVQMRLTGTDAYGNVLTPITVTTNASGQYLFDNLPPSSPAGYTIVEVAQPSGFTDGKEAAGTSGGTPGAAGTDIISAIVLPANTAATGYLFGELPVPLIGVAKSAGPTINNGDGTYSVPFTITVANAGGSPLSNVQVTDDLTGPNATGKFGTYVAGVPAAGQYTISSGPTIAVQSNGAAVTAAAAGTFTGSGAGAGVLVPASSSLPNFGTGTASTAQIQFTVRFFPTTAGPFNNAAVATGTSPTGVNVTDDSVDGATPDANGNGDPTDDTSPTLINLSGQSIAVTKVVAGGIIQTGAKRFRVPYSIIVANPAAIVTATNVQVTDNLLATFPTAQSIAISTPAAVSACTGTVLTVAAPAFNGTTQQNLLSGNQNLQAGERCTLTFTAEVDFGTNALPAGVQNNQAIATTHQAPGGTVIATDISDDGVNPDANGNGNGNEAGENDPTPVDFGPGVLSSVSGKVWLDSNHDRTDNDGPSSPIAGFVVEVLNAAGQIVGTATTAADGTYSVAGLYPSTAASPATYYTVQFRDPANGRIYGNPVSQDPAPVRNGTISNGVINSLPLAPGVNTLNQSLPLDPSGVVYDAVSRAPVAGATLTLLNGGVPVPGACLVGGVNTQTTGASGMYQFLLLNPVPPACPGSGTYTIQVTQPPTHLPAPSSMIPPGAGPYTPTLGGVDPIQVQPGPPTGAQPTPYFFSFALTLTGLPATTSSNVVNNHIPLDPILGGAITVTKTTPLVNVSRGDLVPYTITATNTLSSALSNIDLRDQLPPGFKYRSGTATVDGVKAEPVANGRNLTWPNLTFAASQRREIRLMLVVSAGVGEGEYVNTAFALNNLAGAQVSNTATATVRVIPDPTFDCSDLIGKVFDDKNANGYQDEGEPGIPNVRLATVNGLLVTTDAEGRFHVACAMVPNESRGSNFVMKLDERSLPSGYRVTTENPRDVRLTRGKLAKLNFGAAIHRVVRVELRDEAFVSGQAEPQEALAQAIHSLPETLRAAPSIVRLAYQGGGENADLVKRRLKRIRKQLEKLWKEQGCCYALQFEEEIFDQSPARKGGAQ